MKILRISYTDHKLWIIVKSQHGARCNVTSNCVEICTQSVGVQYSYNGNIPVEICSMNTMRREDAKHEWNVLTSVRRCTVLGGQRGGGHDMNDYYAYM